MPKKEASKETSKLDRDELIEALTDERVIEALTTRLMVSLRPELDNIVRAHMKTFEETLKITVEKLVQERVDSQVKTYADSVDGLKSANEQLKERIEQLETYSRADNLTIHGIPERTAMEGTSGQGAGDHESTKESASTTCDLIVDFCNKRLGVAIGRQDISIAHRLRYSKKEATRPIVVRFTSRRIRDDVYKARRTLRLPVGPSDHHSTPVYINEHLTANNAEIFFRARRLLRDKRITGAWTNGGEVYIKKTPAMDEKPIKVKSIHDLPKED